MVGGENIQFVFISVDPNRDYRRPSSGNTWTILIRALSAWTGDNAQIGNLGRSTRAPHYQVAIAPGMENYPVTHLPAVFLVDPRARYYAVVYAAP